MQLRDRFITRTLLFAGALASATFLAGTRHAGAAEHEQDGRHGRKAHAKGKEADDLTSSAMMRHYFAIREALAGDSLKGVGESAKKLAERFKHAERPDAADAARFLAKTEDIGRARRAFETLSASLIKQLEKAETVEGGYYSVHCPMAFDDGGASWIQKEKKVSNPYQGANMLRCGTVRGTFGEAQDDGGHGHTERPAY